MTDRQKTLMSHILMVAAPLLMLLMITAAWFISSRTVGLTEMSFAAHNAGPGESFYHGDILEGRTYNKVAVPPTLTYDKILWGKRLEGEAATVVVSGMVPGQCEYYLLVADNLFTPSLTDVKILDDDGRDVTSATDKPLLAQCLGFYLIPTEIDMTQPDPASLDISIALAREADGKHLDAALLNRSAPFPTIEPTKACIVAVYCDPIYAQNGPGDSKAVHTGTLPGTVSFTLTFNTTEAA